MALGALPQLMQQFVAGYHSHRFMMRSRFLRGKAFRECYAAVLSEEKTKVLEAFLRIPDGTLVQRLIQICRLRMSPTGFWRLCLHALLSSRADGRGAVK
jgi:hypothetical protein